MYMYGVFMCMMCLCVCSNLYYTILNVHYIYTLYIHYIYTIYTLYIGKFDKVYICIDFDADLINNTGNTNTNTGIDTFSTYICQAISKLYVKLWDLCLEYDTIASQCFIIPLPGRQRAKGRGVGGNIGGYGLGSDEARSYIPECDYGETGQWLFKRYHDVLKSVVEAKLSMVISECVLYECSNGDGDGVNMLELYREIEGAIVINTKTGTKTEAEDGGGVNTGSSSVDSSDMGKGVNSPIEYVHFNTNSTKFDDNMVYFDSMGRIGDNQQHINNEYKMVDCDSCESRMIQAADIPRHTHVACGGTHSDRSNPLWTQEPPNPGYCYYHQGTDYRYHI